MEGRLGDAVDLIERLASEIARGPVPLRPGPVAREAARLSGRSVMDATQVVDRVLGLGPLEALLRDPEVTDILVNGPDEVWVERGGQLVRVGVGFGDVEDMLAAVERVIAPLGLRLDRAAPTVDARLGDGSRLHAVIPPAAVDSPVVAIRRFTAAVRSLDDLVGGGAATPDQADLLAEAVAARRTIVISGGTGSGKTTLLNLLAGLIGTGERIVTIEDAAELRIEGHVVRLEAHPANAEGAGEVTVRALLRSALRLRPDRIIVGEVRGPEALDLISALNTGHRGSLSTVHANSPAEALWRLETLALSAGNTSEIAVRRQLHTAVDLVVQLERAGDGRRRIVEIASVGPDGVEAA